MRDRIDAAFQNSEAPTKTYSYRALQRACYGTFRDLSTQGDIAAVTQRGAPMEMASSLSDDDIDVILSEAGDEISRGPDRDDCVSEELVRTMDTISRGGEAGRAGDRSRTDRVGPENAPWIQDRFGVRLHGALAWAPLSPGALTSG